MRVVKQWHILPGEMVETGGSTITLSLETHLRPEVISLSSPTPLLPRPQSNSGNNQGQSGWGSEQPDLD